MKFKNAVNAVWSEVIRVYTRPVILNKYKVDPEYKSAFQEANERAAKELEILARVVEKHKNERRRTTTEEEDRV